MNIRQYYISFYNYNIKVKKSNLKQKFQVNTSNN